MKSSSASSASWWSVTQTIIFIALAFEDDADSEFSTIVSIVSEVGQLKRVERLAKSASGGPRPPYIHLFLPSIFLPSLLLACGPAIRARDRGCRHSCDSCDS
jgi:hypothetical protein